MSMDINNKRKYYNDMKNVRQWLHSTKTRCDSLKSHMEYMKMLYHDIPKVHDTKKILGSTKWHNSKVKNSNADGTMTAKQINCNNTLKEGVFVNDSGDIQKHEFLSSVIANVSSEICIKPQEKEKSKSIMKKNEMEIELSSIVSGTYSLPKNTCNQSRSLSPIHKERMIHEDLKQNWQHTYEKHLAEYPTELVENIKQMKQSFEPLILENENEYLLPEFPSVRDNNKLNIPDNVKDDSIDKSKICAKSDKKEKAVSSALSSKKGSLCKLDDIVSSKFKKRRRKVHSSNSKSTVNTRDTNLIGRKDMKKRKQKNNVNNRHTFKPQQTSNEVVEIYHNVAAKSAVDKHQSLTAKSKHEASNSQHVQDTEIVVIDKNCSPAQYLSKQKSEGRSTNTNDLNYNLEVPSAPLCTVEKCDSHQCQRAIIQAPYCDPIITHNYEMPTLASKLKRANRSYFSRFSFRNIPFVVGTSVTPSHNLGLNIQEVLSIMKSRQSAASGITPLLIRKISRGIKPASVLMEQMSDQQSKLSYMNSRLNNTHMRSENLFTNSDEHSLENDNGYLKYNRKADTRSENQLNTFNTAKMLHASDNKMLKLFASQQNVKTEMGILNESICDKSIYNTLAINHSHDPKGIREVLVSLHDQFEEMNSKYEKLQVRAKKCNDKDLEGEILNLEKELSIKEDEINAVVNLYKEVMALKEQMRLLQEKKSYVCISTEIPLGPDKLYSTVPFTTNKCYGSGFQHRRGDSSIITKEPTSLRLAGLLRQIQTFQKQLKLMSW